MTELKRKQILNFFRNQFDKVTFSIIRVRFESDISLEMIGHIRHTLESNMEFDTMRVDDRTFDIFSGTGGLYPIIIKRIVNIGIHDFQ